MTIPSDILTQVSKATLDIQKVHEKANKVYDYGAVKLELEINYIYKSIFKQKDLGTISLRFPCYILINGIVVSDLIKRGDLIFWYNIRIFKNRIEPIVIKLQPYGEAKKYFKSAKTEKLKFNPLYTRNAEEKFGEQYKCPPDKKKSSFFPFKVHINLELKSQIKKSSKEERNKYFKSIGLNLEKSTSKKNSNHTRKKNRP